MSKKIIVGNWKMKGSPALVNALVPAIASFSASIGAKSEIVICPPYLLLNETAKAVRGGFLSLGAQDCSDKADGAYTGDISAAMLKQSGCRYVIVGHSERRQHHNESDALVKAKAEAALAAGLTPIICVGETQAERDSGSAKAVVTAQVKNSLPDTSRQPPAANCHFLLAYEPVWAIGSGRVPTVADIADMHTHLSAIIPGKAILYGGSVKAANAAEILAASHVSGVLVGGASLSEKEFCGIIAAAE